MSHPQYLPFLVGWALPVLALQWLAGGRHLWRLRRRWVWVVLALGAYLTLADGIAIAAGIWRFDSPSLLGLWLGTVPLEEVLFYLLTAAMVVQGYVIAWAVWDERAAMAARARLRLRRLSTHLRKPASPVDTLPAERDRVRSGDG